MELPNRSMLLRTLVRRTLLAGLLLLATAAAHAQPTVPVRWWGGVGLGLSSLEFLSVSAHASVNVGDLLVSVRGTDGSEGFLSDGGEYWDVGLLAGYGTMSGDWDLSIAGGVGAVGGTQGYDTGGNRPPVPTHIGLPIEAQAFYRATSWFGFGFYAYGELSATRSFYGATVGVKFGSLR